MFIMTAPHSECMSHMDFFALSERGLRTKNDDAYCAEQIGPYFVFAIAGGLAGHPYGDIASRTAIDALKSAVKDTSGSAIDVLLSAIRNADSEIRVLSQTSPEYTGLVTKLVVCIIDEKMKCTVLDAGEGNCYIISKSMIENPRNTSKARYLAGSHSLPHMTIISPSLPDMISHVLGDPHRMKDEDFSTFTLDDEFILICSDGLAHVLNKESIAGIVWKNEGSPEAACEALVQGAMNAGSEGTITVALMHGTGDRQI